ncbi:MAG: DoxX family protein [Propionibacteriaceae bacterium]
MTESEGMASRVNALINALSGSDKKQDVKTTEQADATDIAETVEQTVAVSAAETVAEARNDEPTRVDIPLVTSDDDDLPGTAVSAVASMTTKEAAAVSTEPTVPMDSLFRDEKTRIMEMPSDEATAEKTAVIDMADSEREAAREARAKRLGIVSAAPVSTDPVVPPRKAKRTTDKWNGSLGLFLLRLATAALLFTQGYSNLMHWTATKEFFARSVLPNPTYFAIGVTAAELIAAVLLVLGLMTRFAGILLVAVEAILLVFFIYGKSGAIYTPGEPGFRGDVEILLAAIGMLFFLLGAGGLAIDRIVRRKRAIRKEQKLLGNTV